MGQLAGEKMNTCLEKRAPKEVAVSCRFHVRTLAVSRSDGKSGSMKRAGSAGSAREARGAGSRKTRRAKRSPPFLDLSDVARSKKQQLVLYENWPPKKEGEFLEELGQ